MRHLGLDISTSCTGWAVTDVVDGVTVGVTLGHINLEGHGDLIQKAGEVLSSLTQIHNQHCITHVYVEENMQAFRPGASSAQTLVKLAKFNGIVSYLAHQVTGVTPMGVNVNHARKALGINLKREKVCGVSTKDQVHEWVRQHPLLSEYEWPCRVISSGPRKGQRVLEHWVYDMSDAFVVALSGPIVNIGAHSL